ncbi:helix-turn-helix domain-containing protein [Robinsoniella peoriensis]|uniref:helix-turn-helix domain-containing protein n=1 Tax=Robinsoniella peoriensis TaxID=180332 RepID=UPI003629166C
MNIVIFSQRLQECRKQKFSSQQAFADAYLNTYGMIRKGKKTNDNNMFGTIQSWEQGKSTPTAEALFNICELLDCDADYLIGRINQRTHGINDAHEYTGLSAPALEQLHKFKLEIQRINDWSYEDLSNPKHRYYQSFALFLVDEILVGSKSHKLSASELYNLFTFVYEQGTIVSPADKDNDDFDWKEYETQIRQQLDLWVYSMTNSIRDIIIENAVHEEFPPALKIDESDSVYTFSVKK